MSGGKGGSVQNVNPTQLAEAQAQANRVSTFTPYGNVSFGSVDADGNFVPANDGQAAVQVQPTDLQSQTLGLQQQTENQIAQQLSDRVSALPTGNVDLSGLTPLNTDFSGQGQQLEQASFDRAMGLLNPVYDQRQKELMSTLANRGLPVGSEAANDQINLFNLDRRNAELAAAQDAVAAGRAEQSRLFGLDQAARNQGLSELSFQRNQPFNELAAAMTGSQLQQFQQNPINTQGVDIIGANALNQQANLANFGAANQLQSGLMGGLFSLGSSLLSSPQAGQAIFSDRRLKTDVKQIGEAQGLPLYRYRYVGDDVTRVGFMADEVEAVMPEAVTEINGYKAVDYGAVINA